MTPRSTRVAPALVAGATLLLALATVVLHVVRGAPATQLLSGQLANTAQAGLVFGLIAAALLRDAPGNRLGPLMAAAATCAGVAGTAEEYAVLAHDRDLPGLDPAGWAAGIMWEPGFVGLLVMVPLLFPDGRIPSPRWRWPARVATASVLLGSVLFATTQDALDDNPFGPVPNPLDLPLADGPQLAVAGALLFAAVLIAVAGLVGVLLRLPRVSPAERPRYVWFATAVLLSCTELLPVPAGVSSGANILGFVALGIGILRHGLFDIEPFLPRALVSLALVGLSLGVYLVAAAAVGSEVGSGLVPALLTAAAALLLARVQGALVRFVRRLLYGERDDPDRALTQLGDRLAATLGTTEALPESVAAVRRTLRVPYAAVCLAGEPAPAAESGIPERTVDLALVHAAVEVGVLRLGLRAGERALSSRDAELLARFTPHLAAVAHEIRTSRELQRSRDQLVRLREAERARIHRDLHDGLGPALAGISLGLETAVRTAGRDGAAAADLLAELHTDVASCVEDVRRIVTDLRPPALDDGGLVGALRRRAQLTAASTDGLVRVEVAAPVGLELPPAVEVAAYRIATEAITNAVRHGAPRGITARVRSTGSELCIQVEDDGNGRRPTRRGTGLESMRLRAEELGGSCTVDFRPGQGTRVRALLPWAAPVPTAPARGAS